MVWLICHGRLLVPIGVVFTCTPCEGAFYISRGWSPVFAPSLLPEASRTHLEGPRVATPASCHREVPAALGPSLHPYPLGWAALS